MPSIGTRELKQNPFAVIRRVLETGEAVEITSHGAPTGVQLAPRAAEKQQWVPARTLQRLPRLSPDNAHEWQEQVQELRDAQPLRDPWEPRS